MCAYLFLGELKPSFYNDRQSGQVISAGGFHRDEHVG